MLPSSGTTGGAAGIAVVKGNTQTGAPGTMLPDSIVVKVTDSAGVPLAGAQVQFSPAAPGAVVSPETSTTDARGLAGARWVLGPAAGAQEVVAHVVGGSDQLQVRFTASARPPVTGKGNVLTPPAARFPFSNIVVRALGFTVLHPSVEEGPMAMSVFAAARFTGLPDTACAQRAGGAAYKSSLSVHVMGTVTPCTALAGTEKLFTA